jgi:hypothetical protein
MVRSIMDVYVTLMTLMYINVIQWCIVDNMSKTFYLVLADV